MCGERRTPGSIVLSPYHYSLHSPHLNVLYKLGKGNAVYESNIHVFETKSHVYIKPSQV